MSGDAAALGDVSSCAASEAGDHMMSAYNAQGVANYQLPTEQVSSMWTPQQPVAANGYAHQTVLGWHQEVLCCLAVSAAFRLCAC